jgi:propionate CoA-transferase
MLRVAARHVKVAGRLLPQSRRAAAAASQVLPTMILVTTASRAELLVACRCFASAKDDYPDLFEGSSFPDSSPKAHHTNNPTAAAGAAAAAGGQGPSSSSSRYEIPRRIRQKVVSAEDAVALVRDGDTVSVSGFVAQGAPEAILKALGRRFLDTQEPKNLTLLFGGGPGDWATKGLNHLGVKGMLKRTYGSHYGQTPQIAKLALNNDIEAWTLPLGSVSRMLRAQSTHSPGHITTIGLGTYLEGTGSACNDAARASKHQPITKLMIDDQPHLMYRAMPIDVAIIRGTTADPLGNITMEHESLLCDQLTIAAAARNSGGIVIAQVKRLAESGSLKSKDIGVPSPLVDCVVVVDEKDHDELHPMSYVERHNAVLTGEIKEPNGAVNPIELDIRKIIARRAFFGLKPNKVVNLGIGLPEGVANVAAEESMLEYITLSTEPGVFGGLPCSGHSFGPAKNATALVEMNQMFDFYDGGTSNRRFGVSLFVWW